MAKRAMLIILAFAIIGFVGYWIYLRTWPQRKLPRTAEIPPPQETRQNGNLKSAVQPSTIERMFDLAPSTETLLTSLESQVELRLYFSRSNSNLAARVHDFALRVEDLLIE